MRWIAKTTTLSIRPYQKQDRAGLMKIAADTAFFGEPIEKYMEDRRIFLDSFYAYYTDYEPEHCWVALDNQLVVGFLTGCANTTRQKIWCLEEALRIKADHSEALVMLGMLAPGHQMYTGARYRKEKQKDVASEEEEPFNWVVAAATLGTVLLLTVVVILLSTFVF